MRAATSTRNRWSAQDGAVSTLVILGISALFGAALLAIDAGSVLHTRRGLVPDTDAAALATAIELLDDRCASELVATGHAETMAATNDPDTAVTAVTVDRGGDCSAGYGTVRVDTEHDAPLFFGPLFGVDGWQAEASSTAVYGRIQAMQGLRPIGLCATEPHYAEWSALLRVLRTAPDTDDDAARAAYAALRGVGTEHPVYDQAGVVHRIPFQRLGIGACSLGDPAGNWGWLDFDGGSNSNRDLDDWLEDGYDGEVDLGLPGGGDESCDDTSSGYEDCDAMTGGRGSSTEAALDSLVCAAGVATADCDVIYVVVFDTISDDRGPGPSSGPSSTGPGAGTEYHPASFVGLVLRGHELGTGRQFDDTSWIDIEFVDEFADGRIGPSSAVDPNPGPRGVQLCAVEHADTC